jgi:hypothetical protein
MPPIGRNSWPPSGRPGGRQSAARLRAASPALTSAIVRSKASRGNAQPGDWLLARAEQMDKTRPRGPDMGAIRRGPAWGMFVSVVVDHDSAMRSLHGTPRSLA